MTGRPLRPPRRDTALDRAWRRRQWRLERAHDDWGLHAGAGDPRAAIHRASGLVRLCRQSVRDSIRSYRQSVAVAGENGEAAITARTAIAEAIRDYRLAIAALARAVTAFDQRNADIRSTTPASRRGNTETQLSRLSIDR